MECDQEAHCANGAFKQPGTAMYPNMDFHVGHRISTGLSYRTLVQQRLLHKGLSKFCHVTSIDGHILDWDSRAAQDLPPAW